MLRTSAYGAVLAFAEQNEPHAVETEYRLEVAVVL